MKQKSGMIGVVYAAILSAIAGYFFRMTQLSGGSSVPLIAFSILMVFVFALAAVSLEKKSAYEAVYWPSGQDLTFSLLGALGIRPWTVIYGIQLQQYETLFCGNERWRYSEGEH